MPVHGRFFSKNKGVAPESRKRVTMARRRDGRRKVGDAPMGVEEAAAKFGMSGNDENDRATGTEARIDRPAPIDQRPPIDDQGREDNEIGDGSLVWDESVDLAPLALGCDAEPVVLDWFGDGRADLLVGSFDRREGRTWRIYRPLAQSEGCRSAFAFEEGIEVESLSGLSSICPIPDGKPTRFALAAIDGGELVFLRNLGEPNRPEFGARQPLGIAADLGFKEGRISQMVSVDWDGDGLADLLVGFDDLEGYWPDDGAFPRSQQIGFNQLAGHPGYDRDGRWRGRAPRGRLLWLKNVGSIDEPRWRLQEEIVAETGPVDSAARPAPLAVCWHGGETPELLTTDARGAVHLYRNFGGQRPPVLMEPRPLRLGPRDPLTLPDDRTGLIAADLDGDRRVELIYGGSDGRVFAIRSRSRDEVFGPEPILCAGRTLRLGGRSVVAVADIDDDGDLDLIVGDGPGRLFWVEDSGGPGDHRYQPPVELEASGLPFRVDPGPDGLSHGPSGPRLGYARPALADWKGRGKLDLIVGTAGGEILYLRNNGARNEPRYDRPEPIRLRRGPLITPPRVRPALADWNGAGTLDLIALDLQGFLCVYPRTDLLEVGPPEPLVDRLGRFLRLDGGFGEAGRCALWAGPWTGSGRLDLLVGLSRGARHVVSSVTGTPLTVADDLPTVLLLENAGRDGLIPRPIRLADGRPLVVGLDGCSPAGVDWNGDGTLDLLVGSDDGRVFRFRRDALRW